METNHYGTTTAAPPLNYLDAESIYSGAKFTGVLLRRIADISTPINLAEAVETFRLSGACVLVTGSGHLITFYIGGAPPAPTPSV